MINSYDKIERLVRQLYSLIDVGGGDSDDADLIREQIELLEPDLSQTELDRLDELFFDYMNGEKLQWQD